MPRTAQRCDTDVAARQRLAQAVGPLGNAAQPAPSVAEGRFDYDGSDLHSLNIWYPARDRAAGAVPPLVRTGPGGDFIRDNPRGDGVIVVLAYAAAALIIWFWLLPLLMGTEPITKP